MNYGLTDKSHIYDYVNKVVDALGGGEPAKLLLLETAAAETGFGDARDASWNVGMGLMQFDPIGYTDVLQRTTKATKDKVLSKLGVNVDAVKYEDLRYNPFLSVLFARLKYLLVKSPIPTTLAGRANYWKVYYNSVLGAGTPSYYMSAAAKYGVV